jgi:hypothetical protein
MGYFEQLPKTTKGSQPEPIPVPRTLEIRDNKVQMALAQMWEATQVGREKLSGNELMLAWINAGLAKQYRTYVDAHVGETVDISDETTLRDILAELQSQTIH